MAAPAGPVLDDHNRADAGPPGGAYANVRINAAGGSTTEVVSNVLAAAQVPGQGVLTTAYGPDWEWYCKVTTLPTNGNYVFLAGVYTDLSTSGWDGYGVIAIRGANWTWQLRRYANGSATQLTPNVTAGFNVAVGDYVGVVRTGTTLEAWHKPAAGPWTLVMSRTDATYSTVSASVRLGLELGDSTVRIDDVGGGTVAEADTTPPTAAVLSGPTAPRISAIAGKDSTDFTWEADEAIQAYELRVVATPSSTRASGTLIESGGSASAGQDVTVTVTDDELALAVGPGTHLVRVFVQDLAGNWST